MNSNMINPANYFNPFAQHNTLNKTSRGVYIPKDSAPILSIKNNGEKSDNIFSEHYDAETDLLNSLESKNNNTKFSWPLNWFKTKEN